MNKTNIYKLDSFFHGNNMGSNLVKSVVILQLNLVI